nr:serine/threonine-protein phosphatase 7 long form homolog [Ipomoea batatas]
MDRVNNPYATDAYRVWYHTHGRLFIGNLNTDKIRVMSNVMHFLRDLHISSGEVPVDGPQAIQRLQEIHVSTRELIVRVGYGYFMDVPPIYSMMHRMMRQRCKIDVQMCDDGEGTYKANPGVVVGVCVRSNRRSKLRQTNTDMMRMMMMAGLRM